MKVRQTTNTIASSTRKNALANKLKKIAAEVEGTTFLADEPDVATYVPTLFPSLNRAIQLGGAPVRCIWLIHGPTEEGKSTLCAGILSAFQEHGHLTGWFDAEHAVLSKTWFSQLGVDPSLLMFEQPDYLEDAADKLDEWITVYDELKENDPDLCFAIVLDSLSKFVPRGEFERFRKEGATAMTKGLARTRGLLLQAWLDHLTPIIGKRDIALITIGQERKEQVKELWQQDFRIKGCQGAGFDASVRMRVQFGPKIWVGSKENRTLVGRSHRVHVFKNRVGYPNETGTIYTSNGKGQVPLGFDYGREILSEGILFGIVQKAGAWYSYKAERLGQGEDNAAYFLYQHPNLMNTIRSELQSRIEKA